MSRLRRFVLTAGLLSCALAGAQNPPVPRESATAYPASKVQAQYSLGAKILSKTQIQNSFATPLAGRYIVVEVGFYPAEGKTIDLNKAAFALRTGTDSDEIGPASPEEIASILQRRPPSSRDVTLYPSANVGYESFPVYDGTKVHRVGGPVYGAGLGVGVNQNTSAATTDSDRQTMETELRDKQLADGNVSKPVAGYLYFPVATKEKVEYQLQYHGPEAVSNLPLIQR
jgi:hypothetical protein